MQRDIAARIWSSWEPASLPTSSWSMGEFADQGLSSAWKILAWQLGPGDSTSDQPQADAAPLLMALKALPQSQFITQCSTDPFVIQLDNLLKDAMMDNNKGLTEIQIDGINGYSFVH